MIRLLFASDSFKGSLSSDQTIELLGRAAEEVFAEVSWSGLPVADGGEGTLAAIISAMQGEKVEVEVMDPLHRLLRASYGIFDGDKAIIEMAAASGLPLLTAEERNPLYTSSYGTGQLILDALEGGLRNISIAIGGSASNDGGMGCLRALGVGFLDKDGKELAGRGIDLEKVASIDSSGLDARLKECEITLMCDVTNPLCGPCGASRIFGGQKGASPEVVDRLEAGMLNYARCLKETFGIDPNQLAGSGAAGGLGAALMIFCKARMQVGIDRVLDLIAFDEKLKEVDLVITGEGATDGQTCFGKVMDGIGRRSQKYGIPVLALSGSLGDGGMGVLDRGICSLMTAVNKPMTVEEAMREAETLYYQAAVRMFRMIAVGQKLGAKKQI